MKKIILILTFSLIIPFSVYAENSIVNYGYYDYNNEISAKDRLIPHFDTIFDFEKSANAQGEKIESGRYYVPIYYQGKADNINSVDEDFVYVDEFLDEINNNIVQNIYSTTQINNNSQRISSLENKVNSMEKLQKNFVGKIRWLDTKKWEVETFVTYNENRDAVSQVGIELTFKIGKSYTDKKMEALEKRIEELEKE